MAGSTPGPTLGPCASWVSAAEVAGACNGLDADDPNAEAAALDSTQVLFENSGRQFNGLCGPLTVRPVMSAQCGCWAGDFQWGGYTWAWLDAMAGWAWCGENGDPLYGCGFVSRIPLAGYPIREIVEVKIDGAAMPPTYDSGAPRYRLDQWRYLTRMADPDHPQITAAWPSCQNLTLDDTEAGTFSVKYTYGVDPPSVGISAAKQLGCQFALALSGKPCQLPAGVSKVTKQGSTIDRGVLAQWGRDPKTGAWATGLVLVDAFLNTYNPQGLRRRPAIISPDVNPYAPALGEQS